MRPVFRFVRDRCWFLFLVIGAVGPAPAAEPPTDPLPGPVVLLLNDGLGGLNKKQFGVFREAEPPRDQHIEEVLMAFKVAGGEKPVGFLGLLYNVSGAGSYNGFWVKLGSADWSKFAKGEIVLRLRRLDPAKDKLPRSINLEQPDTECASNFKLELKSKAADGRISMIGLRQRIRDSHKAEQKEKGYFDLRVPLKDFYLDLTRVHELVLVFENSAFLPSEYRGGLALRGVALTAEPGQGVDELLASSEDK